MKDNSKPYQFECEGTERSKQVYVCVEDCQVLENYFVVLSAFSNHYSAGISMLIKRSLNTIVNLVLADDGDRLVVADVAVKSFAFRMVRVYVTCITGEKRSFFRRIECDS